MKSPLRSAVELLGPLILGPMIATLLLTGGDDNFRRLMESDPFKVIVTAYLFAVIGFGFQSICFAIIMEVSFNSGLRPRSWPSFCLAAALGILSGVLPPALLTMGPRPIAFCGGVGAAVGLIIAFIVSYFDKPRSDTEPSGRDAVDDGDGS